MYINREAFLHSVDRTIRCNGIFSLGSKKKGEMYTETTLRAALDDILRLYNRSDIYVTRIHADNEFKSVFREFDETWDVYFNYSSPQEHVSDIENKNCVLQERFHVGLYRLPYSLLPKAMIPYLALRVTRNISYFPKKTGISKIYSPHTILKQRQVDFEKECIHSFGD